MPTKLVRELLHEADHGSTRSADATEGRLTRVTISCCAMFVPTNRVSSMVLIITGVAWPDVRIHDRDTTLLDNRNASACA